MEEAPGNVFGRALVYVFVFGLLAASWLASCAMWHYQRYARDVAAPAPLVCEEPALVAAGTGSLHPNPSRLGPVLAFCRGDRVLLVDAGRAVAEALRRAAIPAEQPEALLLTTLLPETLVGVDDLLAARAAAGGGPLRLLGPPGTGELLAERLAALAPALRDRLGSAERDLARVEVREVGEPHREGSGEIEVLAYPLPGAPVPSVAYRFESGGFTVTVVGTRAPAAELAPPGSDRGPGVLVLPAVDRASVELALESAGEAEAARLRSDLRLYPSLEEAADLARAARAARLVLTRLIPPPLLDWQVRRRIGDRFPGRIDIPEDGGSITP